MLKEIPTIELFETDGKTPKITEECVQTIGQAFHDIGFVFVRAPKICEMMPRVYAEFETLFNQPYWVKAQYKRHELGHQRGWTPPFTEEGIFCRLKKRIEDRRSYDAKENWFMGPDLPADHPVVRQFPTLYPPNIWPKEVPGFRPVMEELYEALRPVGQEVLRAVAFYLDYPPDLFDGILQDAPTVMRAIYYPVLTEDQVGKVEWGCRHTDINLVTVLPPSTKLPEAPEASLWVMRRDGKWIPGRAPEGCVLAQVGDELQHWTGGHFLSTQHEVRPPDRVTSIGRYSAADFFHCRSNAMIVPDKRWANKNLQPILAGDFLLKRLKEIGILA